MKKNNRGFWIFAAIVLGAFFLLSYNSVFKKNNNEPSGDRVSCANPNVAVNLAMHIHPELTIKVDGAEITIPQNVGLASCHRYLHTHTDLPLIHVESPVIRDYILGDFFWVWGEEFNRNQIMNYTANADYKVFMTVDGQPNEEYENLVLKDKQKIVIEYRKL